MGSNVSGFIAAATGLVALVTALVWQTASARAAARPAQTAAITDGYGALFDDMRAEIARLNDEIVASRHAEQECQAAMSNLRLRITLLENKEKP